MTDDPFKKHNEEAKRRIADTIAKLTSKEQVLPEGYVKVSDFIKKANKVLPRPYDCPRLRTKCIKYKSAYYAPLEVLKEYEANPKMFMSKLGAIYARNN